MLKRTSLKQLIEWGNKKDKKPLIVNGMRQVGKTTLIKEYANTYFKNNFVYLNLFDKEDYDIFNNGLETTLQAIQSIKGIELTKNTLIIIDEVQESESAYMFIKALHDSDKPNNLICSGSYIENHVIQNNFKIPMGCYETLTIYPLSFKEFLINKGEESSLKVAKSNILSNSKVNATIHNKLLSVLDEYLLIGGMPNIVNTYINNIGMDDVHTLIANQLEDLQQQQRVDITRGLSKPDAKKTIAVYDSIKNTMTKTTGFKLGKFKYASIDTKTPNANKYVDSIATLTRSKVLLSVRQVLSDNYKIDDSNKNAKYIYSDLGFLSNTLGMGNAKRIIKDKEKMKGYITENFVAIELQHLKQPIKYWYKPKDKESLSNNTYEVDFIHYNVKKTLSIPIEVKSGTNVSSRSSLSMYKSIYKPRYSIIISRKNFNNDKEHSVIKLPLYALHLMDELIESL